MKQVVRAVILIVLVAMALPADAFAQSRRGEVQAFGGFSLLYRSIGEREGGEDVELTGDGDDSVFMYGVQGDLTYYVTENVGIVVGGYYNRGTIDNPGIEGVENLSVSQFLFLFGPRFQLGNSEKFSPAVHGLIGWAQANVDKAQLEGYDGVDYLFLNDSALAISLGATFDMKINQSWSYRIVQPDVIITTFADATQVNFSLATGIVGNF